MSLSAGTMAKAKALSKTVQQLDEKTFLVQGSKYTDEYGNEKFRQYEVSEAEEKYSYKYVCYEMPAKKLCQGWQFCKSEEKECKHIWAVKIFLQNGGKIEK